MSIAIKIIILKYTMIVEMHLLLTYYNIYYYKGLFFALYEMIPEGTVQNIFFKVEMIVNEIQNHLTLHHYFLTFVDLNHHHHNDD